jgi:hypothetical protein
VLGRGPEPGGDQDGADLVAVKANGMRLVVQPRPPDVRRRRMVHEIFLDRVLAEPGYGGQTPGDGGAGAAFDLEVAGEALDVGPAHLEEAEAARWHHVLNWRKSSM